MTACTFYVTRFKFGQRIACRLAGISISIFRCQPNKSGDDDVVIAALQAAIEKYPAYGFGKLFEVLRQWGHPWNHKRIHRIYPLDLNRRRRDMKRLPTDVLFGDCKFSCVNARDSIYPTNRTE